MYDSNPAALFTYFAQQLNRFDLAYLHIVEPRVKGNTAIKPEEGSIAAEQLRKVFKETYRLGARIGKRGHSTRGWNAW